MIYCEKNVMNVAHLKKRAIQKKKKKSHHFSQVVLTNFY